LPCSFACIPTPLLQGPKPMCRWLAYSGSPIPLEELLYKPDHSLIDQSLHAQLSGQTANGDGFGVGWYGAGAEPVRTPRPSFGASCRLGTIATCVKLPGTSTRRSSSHMSAPRQGRPSSRPTATRSATAAGSGYTTASYAISPVSNANSHSPSTSRCTRVSRDPQIRSCCSTWR
jgi:hypothetical protein